MQGVQEEEKLEQLPGEVALKKEPTTDRSKKERKIRRIIPEFVLRYMEQGK